jgi:hypothetical protein
MGKLDPDFKKKWVEELRSGKWKQGEGGLHKQRGDDELFCCLGVCLALALPSEGEIWAYDGRIMPPVEKLPFQEQPSCSDFEIHDRDEWAPRVPTRIAKGVLGAERVKRITKRTRTTKLGLPSSLTLTFLNDNGVTFTEIADIIEASDL